MLTAKKIHLANLTLDWRLALNMSWSWAWHASSAFSSVLSLQSLKCGMVPKKQRNGLNISDSQFPTMIFCGLTGYRYVSIIAECKVATLHNKLLQRQPPNTLGMCLEGCFHSDFHNLRSILQSCLAVSSPNPESRYSGFFLCILVTSWLRLDWEDLIV